MRDDLTVTLTANGTSRIQSSNADITTTFVQKYIMAAYNLEMMQVYEFYLSTLISCYVFIVVLLSWDKLRSTIYTMYTRNIQPISHCYETRNHQWAVKQ
jgi:hypothetical protein